MTGSDHFPVVLCVDDDADTRLVVTRSLAAAGFEVAQAGSGPEALSWVERHGLPQAAVVDIRMPEMDGIELARRLRQRADLPVVLLTAVDDEPTIVGALEGVAEDYMVNPFHPRELAARVRRLLLRFDSLSCEDDPRVIVDQGLAVDFVHGTVQAAGRGETALTPTEAKILHILLRSAPRTVSTGFLLRRVWPLEEVFEDSLRVHVHRLRQKIEADPRRPRYLRTERGLGYRFAVEPEDRAGRDRRR
jgi:DNA-binding response OmpR family regulator